MNLVYINFIDGYLKISSLFFELLLVLFLHLLNNLFSRKKKHLFCILFKLKNIIRLI